MDKERYHVFPVYSNPVIRGSAKECSICSAEYSFLNSEHICKRCARSVCEQCIGCLEHPIIKINYSHSLHKICRPCKNENEILDKYAEIYKLSFFTNSLFVTQWMKNVDIRCLKEKKVFASFTDEEEVALELWKSLNFSLREFVVRVCGSCDKDTIEQVFLKVVRLTLRLRNLISTEIEKLAYLVLLLSMHCAQDMILQAALEVHEQILSQVQEQRVVEYIEMYASSIEETDPEETDTTTNQASKTAQTLSHGAVEKLRDYLEIRFPRLTSNLGINILSAELAIYFLNLTLTKRSCKQFEKGLAALLISHQKRITSGAMKVDEIDMSLMRDSNSKLVTTILQRITEIDLKRKPLRKESTRSQGLELQKRPSVQLAADTSGIVIRLRQQNKRLTDREQTYLREIAQLKHRLANSQEIEDSDESSELEKEEPAEKSQNEPSSDALTPTKRQRQRKKNSVDQTSLLQEVVLKKNLKIDELQSACDQLEYDLQQSQKLTASLQQQLQVVDHTQNSQNNPLNQKCREVEQLKTELDKLRNEKKNMAYMNELLLKKFNQLSKQLVDKEEQDIGKINGAANQEIDRALSQQEIKERLEKNDCSTF